LLVDKKYRFLFVFTLLILSSSLISFAQDDDEGYLNTTLFAFDVNKNKLETISVIYTDLSTNQVIKTSTVGGKAFFRLGLNKKYLIMVSGYGYYNKTIEVNTEVKSIGNYPAFYTEIEVTLFDNCEKNASRSNILEHPIGRIKYNNQKTKFEYDFAYTAEMTEIYMQRVEERCNKAEKENTQLTTATPDKNKESQTKPDNIKQNPKNETEKQETVIEKVEKTKVEKSKPDKPVSEQKKQEDVVAKVEKIKEEKSKPDKPVSEQKKQEDVVAKVEKTKEEKPKPDKPVTEQKKQEDVVAKVEKTKEEKPKPDKPVTEQKKQEDVVAKVEKTKVEKEKPEKPVTESIKVEPETVKITEPTSSVLTLESKEETFETNKSIKEESKPIKSQEADKEKYYIKPTKAPVFDQSRPFIYIQPKNSWPSELRLQLLDSNYQSKAIGTYAYTANEIKKEFYIEDVEELRQKFPDEFNAAFKNWDYLVELYSNYKKQ